MKAAFTPYDLGADGVRVTEVRSRVRMLPHRSDRLNGTTLKQHDTGIHASMP
jgi:hypothetical protein